jgi:hypothetical protein
MTVTRSVATEYSIDIEKQASSFAVTEHKPPNRQSMKSLPILTARLVASTVLLGFVVLPGMTYGQHLPSRAEVRAIQGTATFSTNGGPAKPLKVGTPLKSGTVIKTGANSTVDLFLGSSAGVIRLTEKSTLALDRLTVGETGVDTAVEVELNLPEGDMYFNANKMSKASRYEIKMPTGVAGIRGTKGGFSFRPVGAAKPPVVLITGQLVFVHTPAGAPMASYVMSAPPAVYFSATEGVNTAPDELADSVNKQLAELNRITRFNQAPAALQRNLPIEPFMSPGAGSRSGTRGGGQLN